ncbi:site-specific integrase [Thermosynechococcus sp. FA-CM-4201]
MSSEVLLEAILATPPDTKTRKRTCMVLGALARFANLDLDVSRYSGSYSPKSTAPRDLPEDAQIVEWFYRLEHPAWRWVYGMLATYGLRPHEAFRLNFERLSQGERILEVLENTKTGFRRVWPCYPEWFDEFQLSQVQLPPINTKRPNLAVGRACSQYLSAKLPFRPYDLRHAWAVRTLAFGLDLSLAAQQMGHSVQVHCQTYHRWITEKHHQAAFEALMLRVDRPMPPKIVLDK